jgi:hypothetical protein
MKRRTTHTRTPVHLFESVVRNALDYLDRSVEEMKLHPKFAVVHFCTGVELLLKAKLLREHWSLVVDKPGSVSLAAFEAGQFISVSVKEAIQRLQQVASIRIPSDENLAYEVLRNHRNQLMHFFSSDYEGTLSKKTALQLESEQCRAWFFLQRRLEAWQSDFASFSDRFTRFRNQLHRNLTFLKAKFVELRSEIKIAKAKGGVVAACEQCRHVSALREDNNAPLVEYRCLVCDRTTPVLELKCPDCNKPLTVHEDARGECACGFSATSDWLRSSLDDGMFDPSDHPYPDGILCGECLGPNGPTVIDFKDNYLCLSCLSLFPEISQCEYCSQLYVGLDLDDSMLSGCELCDGRLGNSAD